MKLKEVKHKEIFCGKEFIDDFKFGCNRFILFDKLERELNSYCMREVKNVLEIEVLEIKQGSYSGYGVGFPVTHIKLDYLDKSKLSDYKINFGGVDTRL